jgi:hypothetical protein
MFCFDVTFDGEKKLPITCLVLTGFLTGNQRALLQSYHVLVLMPHPMGKAKNSNKYPIFTLDTWGRMRKYKQMF